MEKMWSKITWLVVLTILKKVSQWEGLSHILWKITNVPKHQSVTCEAIRHRCFIHNNIYIYIYVYIYYMPQTNRNILRELQKIPEEKCRFYHAKATWELHDTFFCVMDRNGHQMSSSYMAYEAMVMYGHPSQNGNRYLDDIFLCS